MLPYKKFQYFPSKSNTCTLYNFEILHDQTNNPWNASLLKNNLSFSDNFRTPCRKQFWNVRSSHKSRDNLINNIQFCFQPSADKLWIVAASRILFIPFFLLCNYRPAGVERLWPVLFHWDAVYWCGTMIFAISGGYTASLALMYCPR